MSDDFLKVKKFTKEEKWQLLADCIRSGQVEARELHEEFDKDPEFKKWYMKKYSV